MLFLFSFIFSFNVFSSDFSLKAFDLIEIKSFYSSYPIFIPLLEGTKLNKGLNFFAIESGNFKYSDIFSLNYSFRENINSDFSKIEVYKLYGKLITNPFIITYGKTSKNVGISENSLILSKNTYPFLMLDMETNKPLKLFGLWNFEILNGWLNEKRIDRDNPKIIIVRAEYSPSSIFTIGLNRFSEYGGSGRPGFKIWEYPKLLLGSEENISYSKYDTDGYFGYDINLNLSKYFKNFDSFRIYYQDIGSDVVAFWQKEDKGKYYFPFGIKLQLNSYQGGFKIKKASDVFNFEITFVNDLFYIHHLYNVEGYSYKGLSLGEPYGNNLFDVYFSKKSFKENGYLKYKIGFLKQPYYKNHRSRYPIRMKKYYSECEFSKTIKSITFSPYVRFEYNKNFDINPLPIKYSLISANKFFVTFGLSSILKF